MLIIFFRLHPYRISHHQGISISRFRSYFRSHFLVVLLDPCQSSSPITCSPQVPAIDQVSDKPESKMKDNQRNGGLVQNPTAPSCSDIHQQGKAPRRVSLVSLSTKRTHSGMLKGSSTVDPVSNQSAIKQADNISDFVKSIDKPEADSQCQRVQDKKSIEPNQKAIRRVEVITLLDESPEKTQPPRMCNLEQECPAGPTCSDATTRVEITSNPSYGCKAPASSTEPTMSSGVEYSVLAIGSQKCAAEAQLHITAKPQNAPVKSSTCQKEETDFQSSGGKEFGIEGQSKIASPPAVKAPKRVGFVTLGSNNPKQ